MRVLSHATNWGKQQLKKQTLNATAIYLLDAVMFFLIVLSSLPDMLKIVLAIATLGIGGAAVARVYGWKSYFGINMIKGEWGIRIMESFAKHHPHLSRFLADTGAGIGYGVIYSAITYGKRQEKKKLAFMLFFVLLFSLLLAAGSLSDPTKVFSDPKGQAILLCGIIGGLALQSMALLAISAINILTVPNAPAGAQLLIVGVTVPWEWIFGLVIAATIHEFAHGVLCKVENLRILGTGTILWGFFPLGAFVEPDEVKFKTIPLEKKRRILAAGPTANLVGFVLFTMLTFAFAAIASPALAGSTALKVMAVNTTMNPGAAELTTGDYITQVDGIEVTSVSALSAALMKKKTGDTIVLSTTEGEKTATVGNNNKLGIMVQSVAKPGKEILVAVASFIATVLASTAYLNIAIGSINLVPLFITDGARIVSEELNAAFKSRFGKKGEKMASRTATAISIAAILLIAVNLVLPTILKTIPAITSALG